MVQIAAIAVSVAACTTVVGCMAIGAATSAVFYSAGTAGTSNFSIRGLGISTIIGGGLGAVSAAGSRLAAEGAQEVTDTAEKGFVENVSHPVKAAKAVVKGAAKVATGTALKAIVTSGALVCEAKKGCP
jgi:hypothetical protein